MKNQRKIVYLIFFTIVGFTLLTFSSALAQDECENAGFSKVTFLCDDGSGIIVNLDGCDVIEPVQCQYANGAIRDAYPVVGYTNFSWQATTPEEGTSTGSSGTVLNWGPKPGTAFCTDEAPLFIIENIMYYCYAAP